MRVKSVSLPMVMTKTPSKYVRAAIQTKTTTGTKTPTRSKTSTPSKTSTKTSTSTKTRTLTLTKSRTSTRTLPPTRTPKPPLVPHWRTNWLSLYDRPILGDICFGESVAGNSKVIVRFIDNMSPIFIYKGECFDTADVFEVDDYVRNLGKDYTIIRLPKWMPSATPTNTPTSTSSPTFTRTATSTSTNTPTKTPTPTVTIIPSFEIHFEEAGEVEFFGYSGTKCAVEFLEGNPNQWLIIEFTDILDTPIKITNVRCYSGSDSGEDIKNYLNQHGENFVEDVIYLP